MFDNETALRMRQIGLTKWVTLEAVTETGTTTQPKRVGAIIDTGSEISGVNQKTWDASPEAQRGKRRIFTLGSGTTTEPTCLLKLTFEDPAEIHTTDEFSLLTELEPYEVLIGRDLLLKMKLKLVVDFSKGEWSLSL